VFLPLLYANLKVLRLKTCGFLHLIKSFLFYFRFLAHCTLVQLSLVLFASITAFAVARCAMPNEWFGARRAIGARALASKLADALRLIISRKFLL